jgi:hypothetical protein
LIGADCHFALADLEYWVEHRLFAWVKDDISAKDCTNITQLITTNSKASCSAYGSVPEQLSLMLLTILELWQAMDQLVLRICPLLGQYSPAIPSTFLEPLLLPKLRQMERLHGVEEYLRSCHARADARNPSIFSDPSRRSFAVRHFNESSKHKNMRRQIEQDAELRIREGK